MGSLEYFAGIDLGSAMTKVVIMDADGHIRARSVSATGAEHRRLASQTMAAALKQASLLLSEIAYTVATGYGRVNVPFADRQLTELTCQARGVASLFPGARTAIDIGGQDSKGLKIGDGRLVDFVMNDRCAAGTGRFLEVLARTLGLTVDELGGISLKARDKITITNTCTIFAQQEIVASISRGTPLADIVAGLHDAIASRVVNMVARLKIEPDVVFTGGVARNSGVVDAIRQNLGCEVLVPDQPLFTGAIGAAILARELAAKAAARGETSRREERHLEDIRG